MFYRIVILPWVPLSHKLQPRRSMIQHRPSLWLQGLVVQRVQGSRSWHRPPPRRPMRPRWRTFARLAGAGVAAAVMDVGSAGDGRVTSGAGMATSNGCAGMVSARVGAAIAFVAVCAAFCIASTAAVALAGFPSGAVATFLTPGKLYS